MKRVEDFLLKDDGVFPNNPTLPVLLYHQILDVPYFFPGAHMRDLFQKNHWGNSWKGGILTVHHYHSITHEVLGAIHGETTLLLGGDKGVKIKFQKGDLLLIPAGVAHKNLKSQNDLVCIGAYPNGLNFDMNYGTDGERPQTDYNIRAVPLPKFHPIFGKKLDDLMFW